MIKGDFKTQQTILLLFIWYLSTSIFARNGYCSYNQLKAPIEPTWNVGEKFYSLSDKIFDSRSYNIFKLGDMFQVVWSLSCQKSQSDFRVVW